MSSPPTPITSHSPETAPTAGAVSHPALAELIQGFMRDVHFYRDAQFYPPEHPRRLGRINSIHQKLVAYERQFRTTVHLQVREGTLFSENLPIDRGSRFATELATLLRERMTQLVQIRPGVTPEEVQRFADFLINHEVSIDGPREWSLGPNLQLYRFRSGFTEEEDMVSEEEILTQTEAIKAEDHEFSVQKFLENIEIQSRLEQIFGARQDQTVHVGFLNRLFELLRLDPRLDWKSFDKIREIIESSLDLLREAQQKPGAAERMMLLSSRELEGYHLGQALRWQLLRRFVPGDLLPALPREETDLDSYARVKEGACSESSAARPSRVEWKAPRTDELRDWFDSYCARQQYIVEYLLIAVELVLQDASLEKELRDGFFRQITYCLQEDHTARRLIDFHRDAAAGGSTTGARTVLSPDVIESTASVIPIDRDTIHRLLTVADRLPKSCRTQWQTRLLRLLVPPSDALVTLCGGENMILDVLINMPPDPSSEQRGGDEEEIVGPREVLRKCIAMTDDYAMDLVFSLLTGDRREQAVSAGWPAVLKEITSMHKSLSSWIVDRIDVLTRGGADLVMAALPLQPLTLALRDHFQQASEDAQHALISRLSEVDTRHVTRLLTIGLTSRSQEVRHQALEAIGTRFDHGSLIILQALLDKQNLEEPGLEEVTHVCHLMAYYQGAAGRTALEEITRERKGLLHKWSRAIRKEARDALAAWKEEQDLKL